MREICRIVYLREITLSSLAEGGFHEEEYIGVGVPSAQFRAWCLQQKKLLGAGEEEEVKVKAVLYQEKFNHHSKKWSVTEKCEYLEGDRRWECDEFFDASVASDSTNATPTAGVSRALTEPPRDASQCDPPKKYVWIRGKLRCRRPRKPKKQ